MCNPIRLFHFTSELDCHSSSFSHALCDCTAQFNHISDTLCKIEDNFINNGKPKMGFVFT